MKITTIEVITLPIKNKKFGRYFHIVDYEYFDINEHRTRKEKCKVTKQTFYVMKLS